MAVRCTLVRATANTVTKISIRSVIVQNCKHTIALTQSLPGSIWRQAMRWYLLHQWTKSYDETIQVKTTRQYAFMKHFVMEGFA